MSGKARSGRRIKKPSQKEVDALCVVPSGDPRNWRVFWADRFDTVWSGGKTGSHEYRRDPSKEEAIKIAENIRLAKIKMLDYIAELDKADKRIRRFLAC